MKRIWILILVFIISFFTFGQPVELPQYEFKSTSSYQSELYQRQYTVPMASYNIQSPSVSNGPKRIVENGEQPGFNPSDPRWENTPVGDPIIPLLIISFLCCIYIKLNDKKLI